MPRRLLAIIAAIVAGLLGSFLVVNYATSADERALAGLEPVDVLVAAVDIPKGTAADSLAESVTMRQVPATALAPGALASLEDMSGKVAGADMTAGEQLAAQRFVSPEPEQDPAPKVEAPAGMHELTVQLEPRRVIGGHLEPGATVGVFMSFEIEEVQHTHLVLHKALVTRVQGGVPPILSTPEPESEEDAPATPALEPIPSDQVMVTLAIPAADAEKIVFASEWGSVWLSTEPTDAPEDGTRLVTGGNIYE